MSESIQIALISALSALCGGLIGSIASVVVNWQNISGERKNKQIDLKTESYIEFINSMQDLMNTFNDNNFHRFQEAICKILIIADKETAKNINGYYKALIQSVSTKPLNNEQHNEFQNKIINSIRKDLKISKDEIDDVYLVKY